MSVTNFSDILDQCMLEAEQQSQQKIDPKIAAAVLLVAVIKADGRVDRMEFAEVIDILGKRFNLDGSEVGLLLESASDSSLVEHDLQQFTLHLRNAWDESERASLLRNFWEIAIADQSIDDRERSLIDHLAKLLDLPPETITNSRVTAEEAMTLINDSAPRTS